ncbi:Sua5/YciO/YrdC/YwlC family protein [Candidatus Woesearchaeota archaeon]|nr:Sua5/YciO/YrdC/YwlC family protein [Candidatus Woesearchaeota archaeon]
MVEFVDFDKIDVEDIVNRIRQGEIFIYPTDTVYALGCNALKPASVAAIRQIVHSKPLAIIAPNKKWIFENLIVNKKSYIQTLPGPFTFILTMKKRCVARNVNPGHDNLGVRIPYHAFTRLVQKADVPFVIVNISSINEKPIRDIKKVSRLILKKVNVAINDGFLTNHVSTIIDITEDMAKIVK